MVYPFFVNGEFRDSSNRRVILDPSTGEPVAEASFAGKQEAEEAISACRHAFDNGPWRKLSAEKRKKYLLKISRGILDNAGELARLETLNTGKPIKETTFMDIPSAAKTFEYFALRLDEFLQEHSIDISHENKSVLIREPLGVVVLIVPWNYPLLIACWKMAQALAAGNTVIVKPSSLTPLTLLELAKIVSQAGIPEGVVNVLPAEGEQIGEQLCSDGRIDMISFTGSNSTGRRILEYSGRNVKKLVMELGGKSAGIIFKDADIESALNGSLCSVFLNQGQMCTAMSRIFVQKDIYDSFLKEFIARTKRIKLGRGIDYQTQMGPLISAGHREKVLASVRRAKEEGAKVECGGEMPGDAELQNGFFFEPAVLTGVSAEMAIFNEEVFGPVAVVHKFSSPEEAVALANKSNFGLASCVWTQDHSFALEISRSINAGTVWINTYGMFYNEVPYGGFKQSGFGKELGRDGFLEYTRLKNVIMDKDPAAKPLVSYWFGF